MSLTLFGLHIPKCAGTSLRDMAMQHLDSAEVYQSTAIHKNWVEGRREFLEISNYHQLRFVWGYWVHEEMLKLIDQPYLFTGLREPRERLVSEYNFLKQHNSNLGREMPEVRKWMSWQVDPACTFIVERFPILAGQGDLLSRAKNALRCFHHVYFTDTFASSSSALLRLIGVEASVLEQNVASNGGKDIDISGARVENDIALYEWARQRFGPVEPNRRPDDEGRLLQFCQSPVKIEELRRFLVHAEAVEHRSFKIEGEVLRELSKKMAYLAALADELDS